MWSAMALGMYNQVIMTFMIVDFLKCGYRYMALGSPLAHASSASGACSGVGCTCMAGGARAGLCMAIDDATGATETAADTAAFGATASSTGCWGAVCHGFQGVIIRSCHGDQVLTYSTNGVMCDVVGRSI